MRRNARCTWQANGAAYYARGDMYDDLGDKAASEADFDKAFDLGYWPEVH